ncbi:hypothetical protein BOTCAL_0277g00030 [Botryotinia calthae]|uniref:Uncharacterized protein n=1 Tax=Botryotinia calthae TaxID=38488 RepID=A0A4Y8CVD7_9HELO|nr:hypothetical protein BOTCAL_0277g00030 [Botryotinia calthae]
MQNSNVQDETASATEDNSIVDSQELENLEDNKSTLNSQQTSERAPKHKTDQPEMDNQLTPSSPANPISAPRRPRPQLSINTTLPPLSPVNFVPAPHRPQPQLSITTTVYPPRSATVVSWADGLPPQPSNKLWDDSNVYFPHWSASCESFLTKYQLTRQPFETQYIYKRPTVFGQISGHQSLDRRKQPARDQSPVCCRLISMYITMEDAQYNTNNN